MKSNGLYSRVKDVRLPDGAVYLGGRSNSSKIIYQVIPVGAFVRWPSGKPCLAINMYLVDKSWSWTGDTALTTASKLTHFIRYCASARSGSPIQFKEFSDSDVEVMIKSLSQSEKSEGSSRVRNNNTVNAIMQSVFEFLFWFQENIYSGELPLIGCRASGASVVVERKVNSRSGRCYFHHRYALPSVGAALKLPIDYCYIDKIEQAVDDLYSLESCSGEFLRRFSNDNVLMREYREYITARRDFMLLMFKYVCLRPSELRDLPLQDNMLSLLSPEPALILPTYKRRKMRGFLRRYPVSKKLAARVLLYFEQRKRWLGFCISRKDWGVTESESAFLSVEPGSYGTAISTESLTRDFKRLCRYAGFKDVRLCLSMFRHRFLTSAALLHIRELKSGTAELSKQDYRMVLERLREMSGHAQVESLWVYIHLALDLDGVWDEANRVVRISQSADQLRHDIVSLSREIRSSDTSSITIDSVLDLVGSRIADAIAQFSKHE
ncbi:TPA: hypothetical protein ACPH4X_004973 [Pseudomonas aeruginosa]